MGYMPEGFLQVAGIGLFFASILGFFIVIMAKAQKRLGIEKDKTPLYATTTGGQIGLLTYRGPFISLRVYDEFVVVGYARTVVLRFEEIDRVEIKNWMGSVPDRVQLVHHKSGVPNKIIIGTMNPSKVKEIIDAKLHPGM